MNPTPPPAASPEGPGSKPFFYLVQGRGPLPGHYADLVSPRSDLIRLAWGEPIEGAIHHSGGTWTEGRNRLLQQALARPEKPRAGIPGLVGGSGPLSVPTPT